MENLLFREVDAVLANLTQLPELACETALRTGAATLRHGAGAITATTVVCDIGGAGLDALQSLVADIVEEFGLDATIRPQAGAYVVRFTQAEG